MTAASKMSTLGTTLSSAGKATLKGAGALAGAALMAIADAADIKKRDEIRNKLSVVTDYELTIALEIIQDRINKK